MFSFVVGMMKAIKIIVIFACALWTVVSCYIEHDNASHESNSGESGKHSSEMKKPVNWPPKPYFVVNRRIKKTYMPLVHKLPGPITNIGSVAALKILAQSEDGKPEMKYSPPILSKHDKQDSNWTPLHHSSGHALEESSEELPAEETYRGVFGSPQIFIPSTSKIPTKYSEKDPYEEIPETRGYPRIHDSFSETSIPHSESEADEESETPIVLKLPFPKPVPYRRINAGSIGALYSKLSCQQFEDSKSNPEYDFEDPNNDDNLIYMFKNKFPH